MGLIAEKTGLFFSATIIHSKDSLIGTKGIQLLNDMRGKNLRGGSRMKIWRIDKD